MGRAWRTAYEGALYHILSRGNEQSDKFLDISIGEFKGWGRFCHVVPPLGFAFGYDPTGRFQLRPNTSGKPEDFRFCVAEGSK